MRLNSNHGISDWYEDDEVLSMIWVTLRTSSVRGSRRSNYQSLALWYASSWGRVYSWGYWNWIHQKGYSCTTRSWWFFYCNWGSKCLVY